MANKVHGENRTIRTSEKRQKFLDALAQTCNITKACEISGIGRASVYDWRGEDEGFAKDWKKALEIGSELLEDEAVRRAREGVEEPVYQGGRLVGHVRKYSDTLLIFLLKGAKPEKYRENVKQEISGAGGGPVQIISTIPRPLLDK